MKRYLSLLFPLLLLLSPSLAEGQKFLDARDLTGVTLKVGGHTADTLAWKADVVANGGVAPGEATLTLVDAWVNSVSSIKSKFYWVTFVAPDNLIAGETPIYHTLGSDPSTGGGWSGTFSVNGITAGNSPLLTGVDPSAAFTTSDMGFAVYVADAVSGGVPTGIARFTYGGGNGSACVQVWGHANSYCLADTSPWIFCPTGAYPTGKFGFASIQRTSSSSINWYAAADGYGWNSIGSSASASGAIPSGTGANSMGWMSGGVCAAESTSTMVISYMSVTHGMSTSDAQIEYNAANVIRTGFGGGH